MYKRVLLKLSGEALGGGAETLNFDIIERTAGELARAHNSGVQIGVMLGGGNIWRGRASNGINRTKADQMGMLATAINSIAMAEALRHMGVGAEILSAIDMPGVFDIFSVDKADELLNAGNIVFFACGSGHSYFSTDTAAALRAAQIGADALLLAKNIDAVYSADPKKVKEAIRYERLSFDDIIVNRLQAMDITAATFCEENNITIHAFGLKENESIVRAINGEHIGTIISRD